MPLQPPVQIIAATGIDQSQIQDWIDSGRLTNHGGLVDLLAVQELMRIDAEVDRVNNLEIAINALGENLPAPEPPGFRVAGLVISGASVLVAFFALLIANSQLSKSADAVNAAEKSVEVARTALQEQTAALQAQTQYSYRKDLLDGFRGIAESSPGIISKQEAALLTYQELLSMGAELTEGPTLSETFAKKFKRAICQSWQQELCGDGQPQSKGGIAKLFPGVSELCFSQLDIGDNTCTVVFD